MRDYRNSMGFESGKISNYVGRNGYRRDFRNKWDAWQSERGEFGAGSDRASDSIQTFNAPSPAQPALADLEKRLNGVQQDFTQALQKVGETENEKFDLIFAILVELQGRQAQLEESVRLLSAHYGVPPPGGQPAGSSSSQANGQTTQQQSQTGQLAGNSGGHQNYTQMTGQMSGQMTSHMNGQQSMQQFPGVMQADASQGGFVAVPQVVVVAPSASGMQYAMPQMMFSNGAMQQVSMPFVGQGANSEMGAFTTGTQGPEPASNNISESNDAVVSDTQAQADGCTSQPSAAPE
jgi:hypothetical protein